MKRRIVAAAVALVGLALAGQASAKDPVYLGCSTASGNGFKATIRPSTCFLDWDPKENGFGLSLAEAITLRKMHWSSWGGPTASARAVFRVKTYEPYTAVRVYASRRVHCEAGAYVYTRVRVSFPNGRKHTWQTPGC
jgi:hypothetical protein